MECQGIWPKFISWPLESSKVRLPKPTRAVHMHLRLWRCLPGRMEDDQTVHKGHKRSLFRFSALSTSSLRFFMSFNKLKACKLWKLTKKLVTKSIKKFCHFVPPPKRGVGGAKWQSSVPRANGHWDHMHSRPRCNNEGRGRNWRFALVSISPNGRSSNPKSNCCNLL